MENDTNQVTLIQLVRDYFKKRELPYSVMEDPAPSGAPAGITHPDDMIWLGWIYEDAVRSYDNEEIMCIRAADPDFFSKLEAWLKENSERWKRDEDARILALRDRPAQKEVQ